MIDSILMTKTKSTRIKAVDNSACEAASKKGTATIVLLTILIATIIIVPTVIVVYAINAVGGMIPDFSDLIPPI